MNETYWRPKNWRRSELGLSDVGQIAPTWWDVYEKGAAGILKAILESGDLPEWLKEIAMKKWGLVENGTVNIATLQSKKRTPLIIGD